MPVSLQVAEPAQILLWSSDSIIPIFMEHGSMSWEMIKLMITRMAHASQMLEDMSFQPVAGRLAKFLMETVKDEPLGAISRSLTLEEMAARIGSTREMVCRFLHRFADEGLIDITRTEFRVTDQKRLADFAQNPRG
jgi:CRP/FNR family transcriptional regulator